MDTTGVSHYGTYSSTLSLGSSRCRWCGEQDGSDPYVVQCSKCGAFREPVLAFGVDGPNTIKVYHNPDNSLFIEFTSLDKKCMRYTLDPAALMKMGLLTLFDTSPDGKK